MTPRLVLQEPAKQDIRDAFHWYEERSTGLGFEFLRMVRAAGAVIARHPEAAPVIVDDIRRARVRRFPYSLFYFLGEGGPTVLACMHDRRDPRRWQSRR